MTMRAKASFLFGAVAGLLAGSRIGPGLYKRVAAGASAAANHPVVRRGASVASDKAGQVAKTAGSNAADQMRHAKSAVSHRFGDRWPHMTHGHHSADGPTASVAGVGGTAAGRGTHNGWTGSEQDES